MKVINLSFAAMPDCSNQLVIGRRGENEATQVLVNYSEWIEEYGSGALFLYVLRHSDLAPYPVYLDLNDGIAAWTVSATDTNIQGQGIAEYVYIVDEAIVKTSVFPFYVEQDIGQPTSDPPDPYETWIDELTELGAQAEEAALDAIAAKNDAVAAKEAAETAQDKAETAQGKAETAQSSAEASALKAEGFAVGEQNGTPVPSGSPYYENNAEYMKDAAAQYALAADASEGEAAAWATGSYSGDPSGIPVPSTAPQHNNNAYYYNGQAAASAAAAEAALEQFTTPTASASTLPAGSAATASYSEGNFAFGIPKGDPGADAVSPEVTITTITGGHTVKITDEDHPTGQSFDVMDGEDGDDGITPTVTATTITGGHNVAFSYGAGDPRNTDFDVMDGANTTAEDVTYDSTQTYSSGTVGKALTQLNSEINGHGSSTEAIVFTNGGYIKSGNVTTVSLTPVTDSTARYAVVDSTAGDVFSVSCKNYSSARAWCFINSNNKIIANSSGSGVITQTVTAPNGTVKAIFNDDKNSSGGVTKIIPAEQGLILDVEELQGQTAEISARIQAPIGYTESKTDSLEITKNGAINSTTGESRSDDTYEYTDYVEIDPFTFDKLGYSRIVSGVESTAGMAFYDRNKTYLSGQAAKLGSPLGHEYTVISIPRNAKYARFSFRQDSEASIAVDLIDSGNLRKDIDKFGCETVAPLEFCPVGLYENNSVVITGLGTVSEIYAAYDALLANDNNASKKIIGYASDANGDPDANLPIYEYVFPNPVTGTNIYKPPKILLSSGIHGNETVAIVGLYNFVKSLFDQTNEIAACIKLACEFHIVPLINPYGFENGIRYNARNVDLNRNFGANWGGHANQGSAAYSELETQAMTAWLWDNADALFFVDFHNHNNIDQGSTTIMYYVATQVLMHRKSWSFTFRRLMPYMLDEYNVDISGYTHVYEGNTIAGVANEAYTNVHIDASIFETPTGSYATHGRKSTETTGDFILSLLRNYRV